MRQAEGIKNKNMTESSKMEEKIRDDKETVLNGTDREDKAQEKRPFWREALSWIEIVVLAFILSFVMTHFVVINAEVPSESMEKLIEPGDRLFGFRLAYLFDEPERSDVVIFKYPVDESQNFIKRIIGLPGETVEIRDGLIYIDGSDVPIEEDYLPEEWDEDNDGYVFEVPDDCYLMLGDNRNISLDARFWADQALQEGVAQSAADAVQYTYVHKDQILGKAVLKYYPKVKTMF